MYVPLITLIRFTDASTVGALNKVSPSNSFKPVTEISFSAIESFGKCRNSERSISLNSTFASIFLLISSFARLRILPLKRKGKRKAKRINANRLIAVILINFLIRLDGVLPLKSNTDLVLKQNQFKCLKKAVKKKGPGE